MAWPCGALHGPVPRATEGFLQIGINRIRRIGRWMRFLRTTWPLFCKGHVICRTPQNGVPRTCVSISNIG
jgi:hypothetical protein